MSALFDVSVDDGFILLKAVSDRLLSRNSLVNADALFIRECYEDMYDDIVKSLQERGATTPHLAVIGTAGIGKSSFFIYFLHRYLQNKTGGVRNFYYQVEIGNVQKFECTAAGNEFTVTDIGTSGTSLDKRWPLFVDMADEGLPKQHGGTVIIFSSFKSGRYKELCKQGWYKIMPIWKFEEVNTYAESNHFWKNVGLKREDNIAKLAKGFEFYGGAIRNIINSMKAENPEGEIIKAVNEKGKVICDRFFQSGFGGAEESISDVLIHRNPLVRDDGSVNYNGKGVLIKFNFASPYIFKKLLSLHDQSLVAQARQKFNAGTCHGGSHGEQFELLCFHCFKFSSVLFKIKPLVDTIGLEEMDITFPGIKILPLNWKSRNDVLEFNVLFLPPVGNLESGDGFCLMNVNNKRTLLVLQATTGENHPVKMNGLKTIHDCYKNSGIDHEDSKLVFVIPTNGKLVKKQPLTTKAGTVATQIHPDVLPFNNNQFSLENALSFDL
jgi:hypothetical protein